MCGCGKKGISSRRRTLRPTVGPRSIRSAGATPAQIRALGIQETDGAPSPVQTQRLDEGKRRIAKLKRDVIRRKLGK